MEKEFMTIGEKLSKLRKENGYTQESLAEKLNVSRQAISKWEADGAFPETDKLIILSKLYNCSVDYLLGNEFIESEKKEQKQDPLDNKMNRNINIVGKTGTFLLNFTNCYLIVLLILLGVVTAFLVPYFTVLAELSYSIYSEVNFILPDTVVSLACTFIIYLIFMVLIKKKYCQKNLKLSFVIVSLAIMTYAPIIISILCSSVYVAIINNQVIITSAEAMFYTRSNSLIDYTFLFYNTVNLPIIVLSVVLCFIHQKLAVKATIIENKEPEKKPNALFYLLGVGLGLICGYPLGIGAMYALKEEYKDSKPLRLRAIKKAFIISIVARLVVALIILIWIMSIYFYVIS